MVSPCLSSDWPSSKRLSFRLVPWVSFDNLAALVQSETHHPCQLSSPAPLWGWDALCVMSPGRTQTIGDIRCGGQRSVMTLENLLRIIHLKTGHTIPAPVITIADASVELQREHLSIRVASAGVRCPLSRDIANIFIARMVHCDLVRAVYWPMRRQQGQTLANRGRAGEAGSQWASSCGSVWSEKSGRAVTASSRRAVLVIHIHSPQQ